MAAPTTIHLTIVLGRKYPICEKFGICKFSVDISNGERVKATYLPECDKLEIEFIERSRKYDSILFVDVEKELPKEAANILGFESIFILRGEYKMDYYRSAWGKTTVMVKVGNKIEPIEPEC